MHSQHGGPQGSQRPIGAFAHQRNSCVQPLSDATQNRLAEREEKALRSWTNKYATVLAASLIIAPVFLSGTANAASDTAAAQYCTVLLGKSAGPDQASPVLGESCSATSLTDAAAGLGPAAATVLMTWYSNAGWKGTSAAIYGSDGTCDAAGYSFTPSTWWQTNMSSIRGDQSCDSVELTTRDGGASAGYRLPVSFGATVYNDNVGYVNVFF